MIPGLILPKYTLIFLYGIICTNLDVDLIGLSPDDMFELITPPDGISFLFSEMALA